MLARPRDGATDDVASVRREDPHRLSCRSITGAIKLATVGDSIIM